MLQKYTLPLLLLTFFGTCVSAQQQITQVFGPDFYEDFNDADIAAGGNGWAVGDCGLYLKTTNGGTSWTDVSDHFDESSDYISCLPGTNCQTIFRSANNGIKASFDGGQSWEEVLGTTWVGEFDYSIDGTIFSWRSGNTDIVKSTDGGHNWTIVNSEIVQIETDLLITSTMEFGFFSNAQYYLTTDGGQTFSEGGILDQHASLATVANNGDYYAVDRNTKLWRSTDKGVNWTLHNDDIYQYTVHYGLWMDENDALHYLSFLGIHVVSTDSGLTWERQSNGPRLWSARRFKTTENGHLAIGKGNSLHKYNDVDGTYEYLLGEVHPDFQTMGFSPDGTTAYAATRDGLIYKSTNAGSNWTFTNTTIPGDPINIIARSAEDVLYLGENSRLMASNDGGASFANIPLGDNLNNFNFGALEPAGNDEYFIMDVNTFGRIKADGEVIYESDFGGGGAGVYFLNDQIGFLFGRQSLQRTLDGGRTWSVPTIDGNLGFTNNDMHFVDESYGILLGSPVFETHDGGANWSPLPTFPRGNSFATNQAGDTLYLADNGQIRQSPNVEQMEWEVIAEIDCGSVQELQRRPGSSELFGMEVSGIVLIEPHVREIVDGVWGVTSVEKLRAFPNPTDGMVQLDLPASLNQDAVVEVYAVSGQRVLSAGLSGTGNQVDLSGVASGIYLIRVAGNGKVWTGRVVVR